MENKYVPVVKSATDYLDMSEIDITFKVAESEFNKLQTEFVSRQEE